MVIDPQSVALGFLAAQGIDLANDAVKAIMAPLYAHLGQKFKERALGRAAPVVVEANAMLEGTGKALTDVPDRMLIPILERAALNDDEGIAKKWARLLANSAVRLDEVYPAYIDILASLSPAEAAALAARG